MQCAAWRRPLVRRSHRRPPLMAACFISPLFSNTGVFGYWTRPDPDLKGQPTTCRAYNGSVFEAGGAAWKGTVANPAPVDNAEWVVS